MIKILFYSSVFQNVENGPSKFVNLLKELNERSDVTIHFLSEDILVENENEKKLKFKSFKYLKFLNLLLKNIFLLYKIKRLNKTENYNVVWYNNAIDGVLSSMVINSVKHIGMINDDTSILSSIEKYGLSIKYIRQKIFQIYERIACLVFDKIVVNSNYLRDILFSRYTIKREKLFLLYKAIETNTNNSNKLILDEKKAIKVLFVKSDFIRGGLLNLINALSNLPYKFELTIIGANPNNFKIAIDKLEFGNNILLNILGLKSQSQVFDEMVNHHIFCTPSLMEALGVANMEALIHKIPVVYSNVGGIPEVMDFGNNGFAAEPNIDSLSNALHQCIVLTKNRNIKRKSGYDFVKENFNKEKMLNNFLQISHN